MLYQILKYRTDNTADQRVISLGLSHYYEDKIEDLGVGLKLTDIRRHPLKTVATLKKELKNADIICCWMYASNLIGYLLKNRKQKIIWCIRHSDLSLNNNSKKTIIINRICAKLSGNVSLIAYNGEKAKEAHEKSGYNPPKSIVLNNGLNLEGYEPDPERGLKKKKELNLPTDKKIILSIARNNKIKDIPTFIKVIAEIKKVRSDTIGVICGTGIDKANKDVVSMCIENHLTIEKDIFLLGFQDDILGIINMADVFVLHSKGEAFPNVLIQAMASKIPVVTTDVGDVENILDSDEYITNVGDYKAITKKACEILEMDDSCKQNIVEKNRQIVEERYDIRNIVIEYEKAFNI